MEILSGNVEMKITRPTKSTLKEPKGGKAAGKEQAGGAGGEEEKGKAAGPEVIPVENPPTVREGEAT